MNYRKLLYVVYFTLGFVLQCFNAHSQQKITLDSCLRWAVENYPLVDQLQLIEKSKDYNIKNINTRYIPTLDLTAFGGYIEGLPEMPGTEIEPWKIVGIVSLKQTIWDGGHIRNQKKIATATAEVDKAVVEIKIRDIKSSVTEIFFGILLAQAQQSQLESQIKNLNKTLQTLRSAAKEGSSYESDADAVEVMILQNQQSLVQLKTAEDTYRQMLSIFIHISIPENAIFELPIIEKNNTNSFNNRPEMVLFENRKQLLDAYNPGAGEVLPRVSLHGMGVFMAPEIKLNTSPWDHLLMGGLSVTWPISGRAYTFGIDKKRLQVEKDIVEKDKESFILGQQMNLSKANGLLQQWNTIISYDEKIIDILSRRTSAIKARYDNGIVPITEWLQSVSDEVSAKENKILNEIQKTKAIQQYNTELGY